MPTPRVTVVVPVYNPGDMFEACVRSIIGQTLPPDAYEALFVDDGSTDGTAAALDRLAAEHPNVRVIHTDPSGAPGRPRNVGIREARGEYVFFVDADDAIAPETLERHLAMAARNGSDIVVGKFASATIERRQDLFSRDRDACTLRDTPALISSSHAPPKLFRTAFLREHDLVFPEGWRQMEDQAFVLRAYLRARVISILSDRPYYFFREREGGGHISAELPDPPTHFAHVGELFDMVLRETEPGELRDRLLLRCYKVEALGRLGERAYPGLDPDYRARLFAAAREFLDARVPAALDDALGWLQRAIAVLVRADRPDALLDLTRRAAAFGLRILVTGARWDAGRLVIAFRAGYADGPDGRLLLVRDGDRLLADPGILEPLGLAPPDLTEEYRRLNPIVILHDEETGLEWHVPVSREIRLLDLGPDSVGRARAWPEAVASVAIDPERVGGGGLPLGAGSWSLRLRVDGMGMRRTAPLASTAGAPVEAPAEGEARAGTDIAAAGPGLTGGPGRLVRPVAGPDGPRLVVGLGLGAACAGAGPVRRLPGGDGLRLQLPVAGDRGAVAPAGVVLRGADGRHEAAGTLRDDGTLEADAWELATGQATPDEYDAAAYVAAEPEDELPLGRALVDAAGRVSIPGLPEATRSELVARRVRGGVARVRRSAGQAARGAWRRVPPVIATPVRRLTGRVR